MGTQEFVAWYFVYYAICF